LDSIIWFEGEELGSRIVNQITVSHARRGQPVCDDEQACEQGRYFERIYDELPLARPTLKEIVVGRS